jgi:predicted NBD/HSP70 family sugar kinase
LVHNDVLKGKRVLPGKSKAVRILGVQDVRDTNEMHFLHLIRDRQPVSRTDLVNETGLRAGTVSVVVNRLIKSGFVYEAEEAPSKGGRRAVYLQVNAEKAYAVAINIGVHQSVYLVSDFNGRLLSQRSVPTEKDAEPYLQKLAREIADHLRTEYAKAQFWAVGVSVPGLLERSEGTLVLSPNLGWRDVPVRSLLERELKLPVYVENDANVAALSELWYGPVDVAQAQSILFVLVVEGIGTGFILNGELHIGTRVGSGGFGHMPLETEGPECSCGNVGCWEALASDEATLKQFLRDHPDRAVEVRSIRDLVALALAGDDDAVGQISRTSSYIGKALRGLAHGLAPEVIVVGGEIAHAWPLVAPVLERELHSGYLIEGVSMPRIRRASVESPSVFGAIPLALRSMLQTENREKLSRVSG